jgi:hypothetical protein
VAGLWPERVDSRKVESREWNFCGFMWLSCPSGGEKSRKKAKYNQKFTQKHFLAVLSGDYGVVFA